MDELNNMTSGSAGSFRWAVLSDVGKVRQKNEDAYIVEPEIGLFIVSDGMGGHMGGALASKIVIEDLSVMIENKLYALRSGSPRSVARIFRTAIAQQSVHLWMEGVHGDGFREMGATVVVLMVRGGRAYVANLGDSRIYLFRGGKLRQVTRDHSVVSELVEQGKIEPEEAREHVAAGQITRYVGMEDNAVAHVRTFAIKKGDRFLLCSDGLTDMLRNRRIRAILAREGDPLAACEKLISRANLGGGHDNITTLIVDYIAS
jgi:protein phosphatase